MDEEFDTSHIRKASQFLERLGLKYDTMSPPTKRYLLNYVLVPPGNGDHMMGNPGNVMATKFANMVDHEMVPVSGGRVSFPSEFFGAAPHPSYEATATGTTTSLLPPNGCVARLGLEANPAMQGIAGEGATLSGGGARRCSGGRASRGGGDDGYYSTKDIDNIRRAYEQKFIRKLRMTKHAKDVVRARMNNMVSRALMDTARAHGGKITKGGLSTRIKESKA